jgi:3-oxoacyl-[acyl-carrier-protein] synthase II
MAATSRRAVLTGIGVITAVGKDPASFWQALAAGRGGIRTIGAFDTSGLPVHIAGEIPDFDPRSFVEKKERKGLRVMARTIQFAVAAAGVALADSRVNKEQLDPTRFGCEFGSAMIATEVEDVGDAARVSGNCQPGTVDLEKWGEKGIETIEPLWMLKYLPNMQACHVSILHNAQGPNNTITENEAAGLLALGEAHRIIRRDEADFMLVGGAESRLSPLSMVRTCLFEPLSRCDDPARACRPFDRRRDGYVLGEGGGVVVLEELEHARRRGAHIYAELVGFGSAFQGRGTDRSRNAGGIVRAIRAALAQAGVGPEEIDHVNAQGFSTVDGDRWEARAIAEVFGHLTPPVPVVAYKSYFGNLGAGGGTTELAASLLALEHGLLPATLNYEERDPDCPVAVLGGSPRPAARKHFLKISFTHMGQCVAVVCRKW